jgi:TonB family protein
VKRIFKWSLAVLALAAVGCTQKWEECRWEDWGCTVLIPKPSTVYLPVFGKGTTGYTDASDYTLNMPNGQVNVDTRGFVSSMPRLWICVVGCGELVTLDGNTLSFSELADFVFKQDTDLEEGEGVEILNKEKISDNGVKGLEYQLRLKSTYTSIKGRKKTIVYVLTKRVLVSGGRFYILRLSNSGRNQDVSAETDSSDVPVVDYYKIEKKPQVVSQHTPVYPAKARNEGHQGTVFVNALVGPYGRVVDVKISQCSGWEELDNAALEAARHWTFTPGEQRGKPVKVWVRIPFHFKL